METGAPISNPRWECYAQERAKGLTQRKAITFEDPSKKIEIMLLEEYSQFRRPEDVHSAEYSVLRADYGLEVKIFNPPPDAMHWANLEAEAKTDEPGTVVHSSTWRDVPAEFLGARFIENAERMYHENLRGRGKRAGQLQYEKEDKVIPNSINMLGLDYKIPAVAIADRNKSTDGEFDPHTQTIRMDSSLSEQAKNRFSCMRYSTDLSAV